MIKRLVLAILAVLGLLIAGFGFGRLYSLDKAVITSSETTLLTIRQYSPTGKLIGNWNGKYSVETAGGAVIITDEAGNKIVVTGTVRIQSYKAGD